MKKTELLLLLLFIWQNIDAQNFTDSNLPIVIINTDGGISIPDDPKVGADMKIVFRPDGSRNYLTDIDSAQFLNYDGRIMIETRGSTSQQFFDKKPYSLKTIFGDSETNNNVSILGMPAEHDWILNSFAFDATYLRDVFSYSLSQSLGQYASRCVYCEVVINGNYQGAYAFMEKIKQDKNRVNIAEIDTYDTIIPRLSGGYITKADKYNPGELVAWSMPSYSYPDVDFLHCYPKPEDINDVQNQYIHDVFFDFSDAIHSNDESVDNGFPSMIDIPSFVDFMIVAELASNVDVYQLSTYFHKDQGGKLRAGPVWDYNLAYGYDAFGDRSRTDVWQFSNHDNEGPKFWADLFENETFRCYMSRRWNELTRENQPLNYQSICNHIDSLASIVSEAASRDINKWHLYYDMDMEIMVMKYWIEERISWITNNIGQYQGCLDINIPPLVISKINYHPQNEGLINGDKLEFIEITNNGDEDVNLNGLYFKELGISHIFNDVILKAHDSLVLASDTLCFRVNYNTTAFGQYERNLSNKSQNIVLADAWGNIIDEVHYYDSLPWPMEADGEGAYLQLIDLDLDNSIPENWTIGNDLTSIKDNIFSDKIVIFPNPSCGLINILAKEDCQLNIQVFDLIGNRIIERSMDSKSTIIDLTMIPKGLYFIKASSTKGNTTTKKIIIQ